MRLTSMEAPLLGASKSGGSPAHAWASYRRPCVRSQPGPRRTHPVPVL